jgi:serine/threonine-protein kinase
MPGVQLPGDEDLIPAGSVLAGKYRIDKKLGEGGMGAVYEAWHIDLRRQVALKVIARKHSSDQRVVERFRREARMASQARHPNIVEVLDLGQADGHWYLSMELLDGIDLFDAIALKRTYEPTELISVLDPILSALETAHGLGLVHRDLKPENIFLARISGTEDVRIKLLDFGVVKVIDDGAQQHLTRTGTVVGTPEYMAPEQATGAKVDQRADLYAIGCVAYAMLCGGPPFVDKSVLRVLTAQVVTLPTPPSKLRPGMAGADKVDAFIMKALAKRPEQRFQTAAEMRAALAELAKAVGDPEAAKKRITIPSQNDMTNPNEALYSTHPSSPTPQPQDLARTIPSPAPSSAAAPVASKTRTATPLPPAAPSGVSTKGIVIAAIVGALVAALATYFFVRG